MGLFMQLADSVHWERIRGTGAELDIYILIGCTSAFLHGTYQLYSLGN
jgi:hypothetical protein